MKLKCEFAVSNIADEIVAVPVGKSAKDHHMIIKLNEEGGKIIELLNNETNIEKILCEIKKEYTIDDDDLREMVLEFINGLKENNLIDE